MPNIVLDKPDATEDIDCSLKKREVAEHFYTNSSTLSRIDKAKDQLYNKTAKFMQACKRLCELAGHLCWGLKKIEWLEHSSKATFTQTSVMRWRHT